MSVTSCCFVCIPPWLKSVGLHNVRYSGVKTVLDKIYVGAGGGVPYHLANLTNKTHKNPARNTFLSLHLPLSTVTILYVFSL
jgi:hypothetical protein